MRLAGAWRLDHGHGHLLHLLLHRPLRLRRRRPRASLTCSHLVCVALPVRAWVNRECVPGVVALVFCDVPRAASRAYSATAPCDVALAFDLTPPPPTLPTPHSPPRSFPSTIVPSASNITAHANITQSPAHPRCPSCRSSWAHCFNHMVSGFLVSVRNKRHLPPRLAFLVR